MWLISLKRDLGFPPRTRTRVSSVNKTGFGVLDARAHARVCGVPSIKTTLEFQTRARVRVISFILKGLWGSSRARAWVGFGFWRAFQISFLCCCPSSCLPFFVLSGLCFLFCLFVRRFASCSVSVFICLSIFLWIVRLLTCLSSFVRFLLLLLLPLCV